eukprot:gene32516-39312_t
MMAFTVPYGTHFALIFLIIVLLTYGISGKSFSSALASSIGASAKTLTPGLPEDIPIHVYSDSTSIYIKHRSFPKLDAVEITVRNGAVEVATLPKGKESKLARVSSQRYFAIFGFYKLNGVYYIAMVKHASNLPDFFDKNFSVFRVDGIELLALPNQQQSSSSDHELTVRKLSRKLNSYSFLYSNGGYDILRTFQANHGSDSSHSNAVDRFYWNKNIIKALSDSDDNEFLCTKFVNALVSSIQFKLGTETFRLVLIARRSRKQQGQRYIKRGVDKNGEVANFVEIEQIVFSKSDENVSSFVQVRGSIPLYWSQPTPWKPKPDIIIEPDETSAGMQRNQSLVMQKHMKHLARDYALSSEGGESGLVVVNLVDKSGSQGRLGTMCLITDQDFVISLATKLAEQLRCRYVWMDYHYKCKHEGSQEAIKSLLMKLQPLFSSGKMFHCSKSKVTSMQRSLIRTNCVDCLDRTNVVQTAISRWALLAQIKALSPSIMNVDLPSVGLATLPTDELEREFRKLWTILGDELSLLYAGSKAMKRDVTMNGVRTKRGVIQDAMSYLQRYYINNYRDQANQQDLNTILGEDAVEEEKLVVDDLFDDVSSETLSEESDVANDEVDIVDAEEDDDEKSYKEKDEEVFGETMDSAGKEIDGEDSRIEDFPADSGTTATAKEAEETQISRSKSGLGRMLNDFLSSLHADLQEALENSGSDDIE